MGPVRRPIEEGGVIPGGTERIRVGLAALLAVVLLVSLGADLLGGSPAPPDDGVTGSVVVSEGELVARARSIEPRPYWVGSRPDVERFELERDASKSLFIRYLPDDEGDEAPEPLRVATYPVPDALRSLERASRSSGVALSGRAGSVVLAPRNGASAYVVFDDQPDLQIEVFSPVPGEAAKLVGAGDLIPLGWGPIE